MKSRNAGSGLRLDAFLLALLVAFSGAAAAATRTVKFDTLLIGGSILDGTGAPMQRADLGLRNGRIAAIGDLHAASAKRRLDVTGLVVTPGFIDVHSHADEDMLLNEFRAAPAMIRQGVTTAVFGIDGGYGLEEFRELRQRLQRDGAGVNYLFFIGHNGIRKDVMGMANRTPTDSEMQRMREQVRAAMQEGAVGLSSGLMYLPGRFASTQEVIDLTRVIAPFGGIYDSHDRDPVFNLLRSVEECLEIGRRAGVETHVAHLKAVGLRNAGLTPQLISMIEASRAQGQVVTADVYPYDGASARLVAEVLVPPQDSALARQQAVIADANTEDSVRATALRELVDEWRSVLRDPAQRATIKRLTEDPEPGQYSWVRAVGYDAFRIVSSRRPELVDRMIADLARERSVSPFDVLAQLLEAEGNTVRLTLGSIREEEVRQLLKQPWVMISSDGREGGVAGGRGHPRYRGSFARVLAYYVREQRVLSLADAVHRMTGLPASYMKLQDRGVLRADAAADIAIFDPATIQDHSTWDDPTAYATGVEHVFVNGELVLEHGRPNGRLAGRYLQFRAAPAADTRSAAAQVALSAVPDCGAEILNREQAQVAVAFVADRVASAHVGSLHGVDLALRQGLRQLRNSINEPIAAANLALAINQVLAHAADAHLRLRLAPSAAATCMQLPLSLTWSDRGLLVRSGASIPAGSRVLAIGRYSIDELDRTAAASIPHENRYWAHSEFARLLPRADTLRSLGLLNSDDSVDVEYQPHDGPPSTQRLRLGTTGAIARPWIGYQTWPEFSTGLLWVDRCEVNDEFNATLSRFLAEVRRRQIRKVAVDVRGNPGGDSAVALAILRAFGRAPRNAFSVDVRVSSELNAAQPAFDPGNMLPVLEKMGVAPAPGNARSYRLPGSTVLTMLAQRLPPPVTETAPPVEFHLLIDGGTFSSASLFAILVRDNRLGMLIGEPTGNPPSFNASEIHLDIPHLSYFLNLSTARLIRPDVNAGPAETILPDVLAPMTADALAAGSDPALDFVQAR
jgi:N-acyl-D-aspartate/D-glutamate deacylase